MAVSSDHTRTDRSGTGGDAPLLRLRDISKRYGGVHALRGATMTIPAPGVVHGLIGENGSGKSTLLGVVAGQLVPDDGEISLDGQVITMPSPMRALGHGIAMVSQEIASAPDLTVAENVLMGRRLERGPLGINWRASKRKAAAILQDLGLDLEVDRLVRDLRPDQRQMVEIARALSMQARILILDEPTSSLDSHEAAALFDLVRSLKSQGVSVVFVSHRLDELFEMCDTITVLRDGRTVAEGSMSDFTPDSVIAAMVGSAGEQRSPTARAEGVRAPSHPALVVEHLSSPRTVHDVSFSVGRGEIVGLAGQVGSGRSELLECLFGTREVSSGAVYLDDRPFSATDPAAAIRAGLAFVPPDRKGQGLVLSGTIRSNLMVVATGDRRRLARPDRSAEDGTIATLVGRMRVRMHGSEDAVSTLSGGNQQKIAIGKWLARPPKVMMLDEPTRGVDVAAKAEVHALLRDTAADGAALLVSSSELQELLDVCDRILVMAQGRIVATTDAASPDQEMLVRYMTLPASREPASVARAHPDSDG